MDNGYKKVKKGSFKDILIFVIFFISSLFGLFFMFVFDDYKSIMFWFFLIWFLIYLFLSFAWLNEKIWNKIEDIFVSVVIPLMEDFGTLLFIIVPIIGVLYSISCLINNENISNSIGVLIMMIIFLVFDFVMIKKSIFTFNIVDYFKNRKGK